MKKTKNIALLGLFTAVALIFAYVEAILPPILPAVPGIKMGLPNIVIIFLLFRKGPLSAACVSIIRIFLVSLLFGNTLSMLYSLAGGILSLLAMIILRQLKFMSEIGISVGGAVTHNIGQILMAMLLLETAELGYYLVVLIVTGTIAGILIGLLGNLFIQKIPEKLLKF